MSTNGRGFGCSIRGNRERLAPPFPSDGFLIVERSQRVAACDWPLTAPTILACSGLSTFSPTSVHERPKSPVKTEEYQRPDSKTNQQHREPSEICKTSIPDSNPGGAAGSRVPASCGVHSPPNAGAVAASHARSASAASRAAASRSNRASVFVSTRVSGRPVRLEAVTVEKRRDISSGARRSQV